jgi:hypothetical protein
MKFPTIDAAQEWSTRHGTRIFVEIEGAYGVLEVYPGGRKIWWDDELASGTIERKRKQLTPDKEIAAVEAWLSNRLEAKKYEKR